jgi:archaellum component FlaC
MSFINKLKIKIGMTASDILCGMGYKYDSDENLMLREMRATLNYFNELRVKTEKPFIFCSKNETELYKLVDSFTQRYRLDRLGDGSGTYFPPEFPTLNIVDKEKCRTQRRRFIFFGSNVFTLGADPSNILFVFVNGKFIDKVDYEYTDNLLTMNYPLVVTDEIVVFYNNCDINLDSDDGGTVDPSVIPVEEFYYENNDPNGNTFTLSNNPAQILFVTFNGQILANDGVIWTYETVGEDTVVKLNFTFDEVGGYVQIGYITALSGYTFPVGNYVTLQQVYNILDQFNPDLTPLENRMDAVELSIDGLNERVDNIDGDIIDIHTDIVELGDEINQINNKLDDVDTQLDDINVLLDNLSFEGNFLLRETTTQLQEVDRQGLDTAIIKDPVTGGIFNYYATYNIPEDGATVIQNIDGGYWVRLYDGPFQVGWFGISGDGTDESVKVQNMFDKVPEVVNIEWGTREYRFFGVIVPSRIQKLTMTFKDTVWKYPIRNASTTPSEWWRYSDTQGHQNSQIWLKNIRKVELLGTLRMDGEASKGNTFNVNTASYVGQGLASIWRVECQSVNLKNDQITYAKLKTGTEWVITDYGFSLPNPQTEDTFRVAYIQFSRNPARRYRVSFRLEMFGGILSANHQGTTGNPLTQSGEYFWDIPAGTAGPNVTTNMQFLSRLGTHCNVYIDSVNEVNTVFSDTYFRTTGNFTLTDHGFSAGRIFTGSSLIPSYNIVELNDWNIIDTPVGGIQCAGYFNKVIFRNWLVSDPYGKSWRGFANEGARGYGVSAGNSQNVETYTENLLVENITAHYGYLPAIMAVKNTVFRNVTVRKFGRFIGADEIERDLGTSDGTGFDLPLPPGGQPTKVDMRFYVPNLGLTFENTNFYQTSKIVSGGARTWTCFWFQGAVKRGVMRGCKFDSNITMAGVGGGGLNAEESHSRGNQLIDCVIEDDGYVLFGTNGRGTKLLNCTFMRAPIMKNSTVDFPMPDYTSTAKTAITISGTHSIVSTSTHGAGDSFEPNIIEACTFTNRSIFPVINDTITWFVNCNFEELSTIPVSGSNSNVRFELRFFNCKRVQIYAYDSVVDRRLTSSAFFKDTEIKSSAKRNLNQLTSSGTPGYVVAYSVMWVRPTRMGSQVATKLPEMKRFGKIDTFIAAPGTRSSHSATWSAPYLASSAATASSRPGTGRACFHRSAAMAGR